MSKTEKTVTELLIAELKIKADDILMVSLGVDPSNQPAYVVMVKDINQKGEAHGKYLYVAPEKIGKKAEVAKILRAGAESK